MSALPGALSPVAASAAIGTTMTPENVLLAGVPAEATTIATLKPEIGTQATIATNAGPAATDAPTTVPAPEATSPVEPPAVIPSATTSDPVPPPSPATTSTEGPPVAPTPEASTPPVPETTPTPETSTPPVPETTPTPETSTPLVPETTSTTETSTPPVPETTSTPEVSTPPVPEATSTTEVSTPPVPETTSTTEVSTPPVPETTSTPETSTPLVPETTSTTETSTSLALVSTSTPTTSPTTSPTNTDDGNVTLTNLITETETSSEASSQTTTRSFTQAYVITGSTGTFTTHLDTNTVYTFTGTKVPTAVAAAITATITTDYAYYQSTFNISGPSTTKSKGNTGAIVGGVVGGVVGGFCILLALFLLWRHKRKQKSQFDVGEVYEGAAPVPYEKPYVPEDAYDYAPSLNSNNHRNLAMGGTAAFAAAQQNQTGNSYRGVSDIHHSNSTGSQYPPRINPGMVYGGTYEDGSVPPDVMTSGQADDVGSFTGFGGYSEQVPHQQTNTGAMHPATMYSSEDVPLRNPTRDSPLFLGHQPDSRAPVWNEGTNRLYNQQQFYHDETAGQQAIFEDDNEDRHGYTDNSFGYGDGLDTERPPSGFPNKNGSRATFSEDLSD